jgi:hypothetical protein
MKRNAPTRSRSQRLPPGWTQAKIKKVIDHFEKQNENEQLAEHEAGLRAEEQTLMAVPTALVSEIRKLIQKKRKT